MSKSGPLVIEGGAVSRRVTASLKAVGSLVIAGVDTGPLVHEVFGGNEYEYWCTVDAHLPPELMARIGVEKPCEPPACLAEHWSGERLAVLGEVLRDVGPKFFGS